MGLGELFLIALGLSMDAFAVSVCKGLALPKAQLRSAIIVGLYFGVFQGAMPLIGYLVGAQFSAKIVAIDHWIAFILLGLIGSKMIKDALTSCPSDEGDASVGPKAMLPLAVATSIDALAVGVSFAFLSVNIVPAVSFIGVTTFVLSAAGVMLGKVLGSRFQSRAGLFGGAVLVLMGLKILLDHTVAIG